MHRLAPLLLTALVLPSIELSAQARDFLVTSWNNSSVLRYDGQTGAFVSTFVSSGSGNLFATAFGNRRVNEYDSQTGAFLLGSLWGGPGNPSVFNTMIPMNLNLVGETVFLQGVMNDGGGGPGNQIGLTEGLEFLVGF